MTEIAEAKQQIIEMLDSLPPEALRSLLDYLEFLSARSLEDQEEELSENGRALLQEALDNPRPGISNEEFRKELGL